MKPRVLFITGSLGLGGTELAVFEMIRALSHRGHVLPQLALITNGGDMANDLRRLGIQVTELGIRGRLYAPRNMTHLFELARLVRRERIDIVHTFLFDADVYGMLAARFGRPSVVITTRRAIKRQKPHHIRAYRLTNRFADRIIANSNAVRTFTIDCEHVDPEKVTVIPNGIDLNRFASGDRRILRNQLSVDEGTILIGVVGTVKRVKGQAILYESLRSALRDLPEIHIVFVGENGTKYALDLNRRILDEGFAGRVHFTGAARNIPDVLAALDLFVMPSLSEGMSNALLEAMAAGKPIVATNVGGNAENLAGGDAGIVVPPGNPEALHGAILSLIQDAQAVQSYGHAAAKRAIQEYGLERLLERHEALYDCLLGSRNG